MKTTEQKPTKVIVRKGSPYTRGAIAMLCACSLAMNYAQWAGYLSNPEKLAYAVYPRGSAAFQGQAVRSTVVASNAQQPIKPVHVDEPVDPYAQYDDNTLIDAVDSRKEGKPYAKN